MIANPMYHHLEQSAGPQGTMATLRKIPMPRSLYLK